jgi:hypothetical protein
MMRTGEMSSEPETLEHKQYVQKGMAWEGSIDKNERGSGVEEEKSNARQAMDAPDDFFEENDTGNEDSEAEEPVSARLSELPAKRRSDKVENRPDKHFKSVARNPKEAKHKKDRKVASPVTMQDSFFGDESE